MSCNSNKQIDIQGHRGCRGLLPENSLPAFEKAIDIGVNTLELDIVISKDHKVVVSHEPYMNPVICYNPKGLSIPYSLEPHYNLFKMNYDFKNENEVIFCVDTLLNVHWFRSRNYLRESYKFTMHMSTSGSLFSRIPRKPKYRKSVTKHFFRCFEYCKVYFPLLRTL